MEPLGVAVGVLRRPDGRVLVAHRDAERHQGGALEFPGGKIESGESAEDALARELHEELGVRPTRTERLIRIRHDYADRAVALEVQLVHAWEGTPCGAEGQMVEWRAPQNLMAAQFPAANRPIIAALRLPALYLITPPPRDGSPRERERIAEGVRRAIAQGIRLVQLRAHGLDARAWHALIESVAANTRAEPSCSLLVNAPVSAVRDLPPDVGLHLAAGAAHELDRRPIEHGRLFGCSCHDTAELAAATRCDADLAVLGPVRATPSHPGRSGIGWPEFSRLAATTTLPLYALGGVGAEDLAEARAAGAIGVAGIRNLWPGS